MGLSAPAGRGISTAIADALSVGARPMLLSWLRPRREQGQERNKRPTSFRPVLESLDSRIVPAAHFNYASSPSTRRGWVVSFKEAGLGSNISRVESP